MKLRNSTSAEQHVIDGEKRAHNECKQEQPIGKLATILERLSHECHTVFHAFVLEPGVTDEDEQHHRPIHLIGIVCVLAASYEGDVGQTVAAINANADDGGLPISPGYP